MDGTLEKAPGVLGAARTTYVTTANVMILLGCKRSKAYDQIRKVNELAERNGNFPYGHGKTNKYIFAEKFGIPIDVVNAVIDMEQEVGSEVLDVQDVRREP